MRIGYLSDIHLEFNYIELYNTNKIDVLIIAGDTCPVKNITIWNDFLNQISKEFETIFIILGNHCYYHGSFKTTYSSITSLINKFQNIKLLNRTSEQIKNVTIHGTTLWTPIKTVIEHYLMNTNMNDTHVIKDYNCDIQNKEFNKNKKWLKSIKRKDGINLLITHHLPHESCIAEQFKNSRLNFCFCANLEEELINKFDIVIFGHTHIKTKVKLNNTIMLCNPVGYPGEKSGYTGIEYFDI